MKKKVEIKVESGAACGKSAIAFAIAHMLKAHGVECSVSGAEDEIEGVMEATWPERLKSLTSGDFEVSIETIRTCYSFVNDEDRQPASGDRRPIDF